MSEENKANSENGAAENTDQKNMRPCPHCKEMILKGAKKCPHCHGKIKPLWIKIVVPLVVILIIFGIGYSCMAKKAQMGMKNNLKEIKETATAMVNHRGSPEDLLKMAQTIKKLSTVTEKEKKNVHADNKEILKQLEEINGVADEMIQCFQDGDLDMRELEWLKTAAAEIADSIKLKK